ncbi:MAG: hypothetical protein EBU93_01630 [Chlamydiae bacterium]|nr:hypothetical protein [Chlamydiota bacterium]
MAKTKRKLDLSVLEAVDNLSSMAEIDLEEGKNNRQVLLEKLKERANWISYESKKQTDEKIKETFSTIHHYLEYMQKQPKAQEKKNHFQNGVQAIKGLMQEAIYKIDGLKKILHPKEKMTSIQNFEEVQQLNQFIQDFEKFYYDPKVAEEEMDLPGSLYAYDPKELIKDYTVLKNDTDYELLFIRREDNLPFFSQEALAHAKMICDFDLSYIDFAQDNPLAMMKIVQDDEACTVAQEIYEKIKEEMTLFLKAYKSHQEDSISSLLFRALIALTAAKNPENLMKTDRKKSCLAYFKDFHTYLEMVTSHQLISKLDEDPYHEKVKKVIQKMNGWFFLHSMDHPKGVEVIKELLHKGQLKPMKRHSIWSWFLDSYHILEEKLKKYPNAPVFKLIEQYENGDFDRGFDSIYQGNTPSSILTFILNDKPIQLLYLPSPTLQSKVNKANIISEFDAFLNLNPSKKLILFNLQDRQFAAKARTHEIEKAPLNHPNLKVVSLSKDTHFYHQQQEYFDLDEAASFMKALYDQVQGAPVSGLHFPSSINIENLKHFSQAIIPWIHEHLFAKNKTLTRKNRLDFIEIFYGFLIFEIIQISKVDYVSFTCKDALDIGSLNNLQFFSLLQFFINPQAELKEADHDSLVKIALVPAFIQRGRLAAFSRIERMISALSTFDEIHSLHFDEYQKLFKLFSHLSITDWHWT